MIKPMLCEKTTREDLNQFKNNWKANIKFDGERIIAIKNDDGVFLYNRRGRLKNSFYLEIVEDLKRIDNNFILDGEVISYDDDFQKLQRRALTQDRLKQEQLRKEVPVKYMVFDILSYNGDNLEQDRLEDRQELLEEFLSFKCEDLRTTYLVEYGEVIEMLNLAETEDREGIIIKNMLSPYQHKRSGYWVKLKFFKQTELTLTQYTINNAGIRAEDKDLNAVQISGQQHKAVKDKIDSEGYCEVTIQYLEQSETTKRYRFPSFVGVKKNV